MSVELPTQPADLPAAPPRTAGLGRRFMRGAFWLTLGNMTPRALALPSAIVLAHVLGQKGFGELGMIQSTVALFGTFAGFSMGLTATKFVAELIRREPERAGRIISLCEIATLAASALVSAVMLAAAAPLAGHTLAAPHLAGPLRIAVGLLFFSAICGVQWGVLAGFEAFREMALLNCAVAILSFPVLVAAAFWGGLEGALWAYVASNAVNCLLNHFVVRRAAERHGVPIDSRGARAELSILWSYSLPGVLSGIAYVVVTWLSGVLVVNQKDGYAEMGLFNATRQWQTALMFFPSVAIQSALPLLSATWGAADGRADYNRTVRYTQSLTVLLILPAGALLLFLSRWIMAWYGASFEAGALVFACVILSVMVQSTGIALGSAIQASGRMWLGLITNALWGAVLLSLVWTLAPRWGALALALGLVVSYFLHTFWSYLVLARELPRGMLTRILQALAWVAALMALYLAFPRGREWLAVPVTGLTLLVSLYLLVERDVRTGLFRVARERLRLH